MLGDIIADSRATSPGIRTTNQQRQQFHRMTPMARPTAPRRSRTALRPHDPTTGEEIEREQVVKGYEYQRGQFVTFTPEELKALDVQRLAGHRPREVTSCAVNSIPSTSTARIIFIPMARSRSKRFG
jgi:hypothetical protein